MKQIYKNNEYFREDEDVEEEEEDEKDEKKWKITFTKTDENQFQKNLPTFRDLLSKWLSISLKPTPAATHLWEEKSRERIETDGQTDIEADREWKRERESLRERERVWERVRESRRW